MRKIICEFKEYWPFATAVIQKKLRYKFTLFLQIFGDLIRVLVIYYLWMSIYNNSTTGIMANFTKTDMITYIVISYLTSKIIILSYYLINRSTLSSIILLYMYLILKARVYSCFYITWIRYIMGFWKKMYIVTGIPIQNEITSHT